MVDNTHLLQQICWQRVFLGTGLLSNYRNPGDGCDTKSGSIVGAIRHMSFPRMRESIRILGGRS